MFSQLTFKSELSTRQNLQSLFVLRNFMLASEAFLIFFTTYGLNIQLPKIALWVVVLLIGLFNLYTWTRLQTDEFVTTIELFLHLVSDVIAITALLYLTGGASNPIIWVYLLPLIITAVMLPQSYAWFMGGLTTLMYTILMAYNVPLPSIAPHVSHFQLDLTDVSFTDVSQQEILHQLHKLNDRNYFNLHVFGMWFGFVFSAGLVAFFVVELAQALRLQERNLAEARENALRDERIVALGTLAASAAHEMGTPLGTMAIVAHELIHEYPEHRYPDLHEKIILFQEQIARCKTALSVMSATAGEMRAESGNILPVSDYLDDVINQWRTHKAITKLNFFIDPYVATDAKIIAERTLTHSLINILNNAAEVTNPDKGIDFHAQWNLEEMTLRICDYGDGFSPDLLDFAGKAPLISGKHGLGVGLFLTYSTITRLGGKVIFFNSTSGGACVEIQLPLFLDNSHII